MTAANELAHLKGLIQAAHEEMHEATAYHEAWRPMVYDTDLHERMRTSYASNTFSAIRQALRSEMLLALVRIWDRGSRAVGMAEIGKLLSKPEVIEALVQEIIDDWLNIPITLCREDVGPEEEAEIAALLHASRERDAGEQGQRTRETIAEALGIIAKYEEGGSGFSTLKALRTLRNEHLAHRQLEPSALTSAGRTEQELDKFFADMLRLIWLLKSGLEHTDYQTQQTVDIHRKNAGLFWRGVRGERTEGHPDYKLRPSRGSRRAVE